MTFVQAAAPLNVPESVKRAMERARAEGKRRSISDFAGRRTGQPIRRHSHRFDRLAPQYRDKISKAEARKIVIAATMYDRTARENGKRVLGRTALQILEFLANLAAYSGRVEPSYRYIMEQVGCCKDSITRALKALHAHGFLEWVRRYIPTGKNEGPQVQQTTNAYRIKLPALAKRLLERKKETSPIPDDVEWEAIQRARAVEAMRSTLTMREQLAMDFDDPAMAELMARIWAPVHYSATDSR
ncbi:hypothetical protein M527_12420 [Sphingobium indicum IP26]|uniref:helix-turn-helix domain-containing protein n=1 Tax=Sphingobium indicum TaxID=332055 RepID=UPI00036CBD9B|nr:hypothetical protein M527_12420 [Sphingobium indicum IP26]